MTERFLIGQTVELLAELRDGNADTVLPMSAAVLKLKRPSSGDYVAVTTSLSPDQRTATAQVTVDELGEWLTRWEMSGPPDAVDAGSFAVDAEPRLPSRSRTAGERGERGPPGPPGEQPMSEDMPTSGTWQRGAVVWASTRNVDVAGRRILGWQRETAGSQHVAGVDWTTIYADVFPGPGYLLTEAGERLVTEDGERVVQESTGTLEPKKLSQLPAGTRASGQIQFAGSQGGATRRFTDDSLTGPVLVIDGGHGTKPGAGQPTGDQSQVIRDAAAELLSRFGHGRLVFRNCLAIGQKVILPPNVSAGFETPPLADKDWDSGNGLTRSPALYFGPNGQLQAMHSLSNICALPMGFSAPVGTDTYPYSTSGMMASLDFQMAMLDRPAPFFVGNGADASADDLLFQDLSAFGFSLIMDSMGATRSRLRNIYGDCAGGVKVFNSGGNVTIQRILLRAFLARSGGARNITCPILATSNVGGKLTLTVGPAREPPSAKPWTPGGFNSGAGKKVYWADKLYNTNNEGFFDTTPPTHGPTPRKADNGQVELIYIGPWTDGALAPATTIPVTTGGFLKPGHSILLRIPPRDCYSGNPSYPHWSTPGAPEDIATMGGDIVDPMMRGRMTVYSFGTTTADYWTVTLDCPYDAGMAAACEHAWLGIIPNARFGSAVWTSDADGMTIIDLLSKGPRIDLRAGGSSHKVAFATSEDSNSGEEDVDDFGNITVALSKGAIRSNIAWNAKSKGTLLRIDTKKNNYVEAEMLLRGATFRAIHHVSGAAIVRANFEGNAIVHSEPTARHLILDYVGQIPTVTSPDGLGKERVTLSGHVLMKGRNQFGHGLMGANGVQIGLGLTEEAWQPETAYTRNRIVTNLVQAEGVVYLYRQTAESDQVSGTGDGPQHITGSAADGTCVWACIGIYAGGQTLVDVRRDTGGVDVYGADEDTGDNAALALSVRKDRVEALVPILAPNLPPAPTLLNATTVGSVSQAMTVGGTAAVGTASGYDMDDNAFNGTSRLLTLRVLAHNVDDSGAGSAGECAGWVLPLLMLRGSNASNCSVHLVGGGSTASIPPTTGADTDLGTARLTLAMSTADFVVTADASGITGGRTVNWTARLTEDLVSG